MIPLSLYLLLHGLYITLRVSGGGSFPKPLDAKEEREYLLLAAAGDMEARNILIERNLRLVAHVIKKYYTQASDQDDLISIGTIGLIKAVSTFDPTKKTRLATYAGRCIENEILMHFRSKKKTAGEVSLSDSIDSDKDGNTLLIGDTLCDDGEEALEKINYEEMQRILHRCVAECLDERERMVITLRYGLNQAPPLTQREIAEQCGISRSYVSRIEKKALKKLNEAMEEYSDYLR
ncbi:RNA polymerase sporulation sigma factor SigK [Oscillospiraceae bacterium OttesenSCG-928-G22]|nr:RNA polymerase sporulation sigma factor SigK [Oscillospiraceae bacterium OttesenSCG-928-G22]